MTYTDDLIRQLINKRYQVRRKVFVSYHHEMDQYYANSLRDFYGSNNTLIDRSLSDEIDSENDDYILSRIKTEHLKETTVTIVLIGAETWKRKWVDWEIYSSLRPYGSRTVNGLLGILLPSATKLPPRFSMNYREGLPPYRLQLGYAKLISWNSIAPPIQKKYFNDPLQRYIMDRQIQEKRNILSDWIEKAFNNRANTGLINNSLPRFKKNL